MIPLYHSRIQLIVYCRCHVWLTVRLVPCRSGFSFSCLEWPDLIVRPQRCDETTRQWDSIDQRNEIKRNDVLPLCWSYPCSVGNLTSIWHKQEQTKILERMLISWNPDSITDKVLSLPVRQKIVLHLYAWLRPQQNSLHQTLMVHIFAVILKSLQRPLSRNMVNRFIYCVVLENNLYLPNG